MDLHISEHNLLDGENAILDFHDFEDAISPGCLIGSEKESPNSFNAGEGLQGPLSLHNPVPPEVI